MCGLHGVDLIHVTLTVGDQKETSDLCSDCLDNLRNDYFGSD